MILLKLNLAEVCRELLDSIRNAVSQKGIDLSYQDIIYDGNKLTRLEIQVIAGNKVGHGTTNFILKANPLDFELTTDLPPKFF